MSSSENCSMLSNDTGYSDCCKHQHMMVFQHAESKSAIIQICLQICSLTTPDMVQLRPKFIIIFQYDNQELYFYCDMGEGQSCKIHFQGDELGLSEEVRKLQENNKLLMKLFNGKKFFLSRETPRESLTFILRFGLVWIMCRVLSMRQSYLCITCFHSALNIR